VDGQLDGRGTFEQQRWFAQQLKDAPADRALIVTVHHAPYSLDSSHGGYGDIGGAIDRAGKTSGRMPNLVLSGHVHNYQRFTRKVKKKKITYVVAGAGGYADTLRAMHKVVKDPVTGRKIAAPFQTSRPDVKLEAFNDTEPGFLCIKVTKKAISCDYYSTDFNDTLLGVRDTFTIAL
jgi:3',5'-cyclic AMP phosphodiesterase CpdA